MKQRTVKGLRGKNITLWTAETEEDAKLIKQMLDDDNIDMGLMNQACNKQEVSFKQFIFGLIIIMVLVIGFFYAVAFIAGQVMR